MQNVLNLAEAVRAASESLLSTWEEGRRVLVILGAGASVDAGIPLMSDVYRHLGGTLHDYRHWGLSAGERKLASELQKWLRALENGDAPRSWASMGLGMFQKAHEMALKTPGSKLFPRLRDNWRVFSNEFTAGKINNSSKKLSPLGESDLNEAKAIVEQHPFSDVLTRANARDKGQGYPNHQELCKMPLTERPPTLLHRMLARWSQYGLIDLVSLNFDGLTQKAINDYMEDSGKEGASVVITEPSSVKSYYFGDSSDRTQIVPVIKVWGDVFHCVCTNPRCPEVDVRVPIFRLKQRRKGVFRSSTSSGQKRENGMDSQIDDESNLTSCPSCQLNRQLQIYFTGYEEKESKTEELMREILKYLGPQIGCVLTVGFSGLWDDAVIDFLSVLCTDLQSERGMLGKNTETCICLDPAGSPALLQELSKRGVSPLHLKVSGKDFVEIFNGSGQAELLPHPSRTVRSEYLGELRFENEQLWSNWAFKKRKSRSASSQARCAFPQSYGILAESRTYLSKFRQARQLGIKTKVCLAATLPSSEEEELDEKEKEHNRLIHSRGAAHLAIPWFRSLVDTLPNEIRLTERQEECLASVVLYSAAHHDIGHLPFTHLAEEVYEELHWSLRDWSGPFRHDEPVVINPYRTFADDIKNTFELASCELHVDPTAFRFWVENAIQGRSGHHWIDAIINSPLDVDKLDYVFRDCDYLQQFLHFSKSNKTRWIETLISNTRVLPSGVVALEGAAGEQAREFFEERQWLYKHQYFQVGYRALERLARSVIVFWLVQKVTNRIAAKLRPQKSESAPPFLGFGEVVGDVSKWKGEEARDLLWENIGIAGESQLLLDMVDDILDGKATGLVAGTELKLWVNRCRNVFKTAFKWRPQQRNATLVELLENEKCITCSGNFYIPFVKLREVREIIRQIETQKPFRAVFDIAVFPRMLSYPSRRRLDWRGETILGECFAVSHYDPDKWGKSNGRWIPLSESAMAEVDKRRWAKLLVVSPYPDDPHVMHALDRFRRSAKARGIDVLDVDPNDKQGIKIKPYK